MFYASKSLQRALHPVRQEMSDNQNVRNAHIVFLVIKQKAALQNEPSGLHHHIYLSFLLQESFKNWVCLDEETELEVCLFRVVHTLGHPGCISVTLLIS
jgi:hypothetical protein